uniref:Uncharacterized protein n=1 Tax=Arundo donax TaxID=35708 RepID=A0A0A9DHJ6_ARUDO
MLNSPSSSSVLVPSSSCGCVIYSSQAMPHFTRDQMTDVLGCFFLEGWLQDYLGSLYTAIHIFSGD